MAFSIAPAIWSCARIQMQDFTMRAKEEAELEIVCVWEILASTYLGTIVRFMLIELAAYQ